MPIILTLPPVPSRHPENAWGQLSLEHAIAFCKAGLIDPAIIAWLYPTSTLDALAPEILVASTENFPVLMEITAPAGKPKYPPPTSLRGH